MAKKKINISSILISFILVSLFAFIITILITSSVAFAKDEKFLKLTSPNGGEVWITGSTYDIT